MREVYGVPRDPARGDGTLHRRVPRTASAPSRAAMREMPANLQARRGISFAAQAVSGGRYARCGGRASAVTWPRLVSAVCRRRRHATGRGSPARRRLMRNRTWCGTLLSAAAAVLAVVVSAPAVEAQTPFVPYFGKNQVRYDHFQWQTYETEHFIIYFYPEIRPHLERMAGYAESAYQAISADLKHDLAEKVPLILFQTSSEFQEQNVIPGAAQEGVGAFAEPIRKRIVMPMDEPPDLLYRLIVHELTHQFEFDIIPTSLMRRNVPMWVNERSEEHTSK